MIPLIVFIWDMKTHLVWKGLIVGLIVQKDTMCFWIHILENYVKSLKIKFQLKVLKSMRMYTFEYASSSVSLTPGYYRGNSLCTSLYEHIFRKIHYLLTKLSTLEKNCLYASVWVMYSVTTE